MLNQTSNKEESRPGRVGRLQKQKIKLLESIGKSLQKLTTHRESDQACGTSYLSFSKEGENSQNSMTFSKQPGQQESYIGQKRTHNASNPFQVSIDKAMKRTHNVASNPFEASKSSRATACKHIHRPEFFIGLCQKCHMNQMLNFK